jgi:hypothetical protein
MTRPRVPCEHPAPLVGKADPAAPGYIVTFHDDVDAQRETDRLAALHGFTPRHVYRHAVRGFSAELPPEVVERLRCEPAVKAVRHDSSVEADEAR